MTYLSQISMPRFSRYLTAAVLIVGLFAVGALSNPASAPATGSAVYKKCEQPKHVKCYGTHNGNPIVIDIDVGNIKLSNIDLTLLVVELNKLTVVDGDIVVYLNNVASGTVIIVKNLFNLSFCQVKVYEQGKTNNNHASCR